MPEPSTITVALIAAAGVGSLATLFWLFQKHIDGRPLLRYEPRRPVPWNFLAPLAIMAPLLGVSLTRSSDAVLKETAEEAELAAAVTAGAAAGAPLAATVGCAVQSAAVDYASRRGEEDIHVLAIWSQVAASLALTAACWALLALAYGASRQDLGLPGSATELRRDVQIGATAFLAALFPIYAVQILLTSLLEPEHVHPLIEELAVNHSPQMLIAAAMAAVVAAPIYEETAFRLTFQGWLERIEAKSLRRSSPDPSLAIVTPAIATEPGPPVDDRHSPGVAPGLPLGWAPILISGVWFAAMHWGHGVAPGSLVVLGVVMGYLYQRTHRIVPSMVCHMLFNGFSIVVLWLELLTSADSLK